jgi:hypothetical protein
LVHYQIAHQVPTSALDYTHALAGLVEVYFSRDFSMIATEIQAHSERVAQVLNDWATTVTI